MTLSCLGAQLVVAPQIGVAVGAASAGAVLLDIHRQTGVRLNDATVLCLLMLLRSLVLGRVRIIGTVDARADAAVGLSEHGLGHFGIDGGSTHWSPWASVPLFSCFPEMGECCC
jgi:hypothetical protein